MESPGSDRGAVAAPVRGADAPASHPPRILVPGVGWPLETFVEQLLAGLAARGVEITLVSAARPESSWLRRTGIHWRFGPGTLDARSLVRLGRRCGLPAAAAATRAAAASALGSRGPHGPFDDVDLVYAPWINALTDRPEWLDLGLPVVTSCRGSLVTIAPWDPGRVGYREALEGVLRRATLVHCVSEDLVDVAADLGLDRARARVVHPGVDLEVHAPVAAQRPDGGPLRVLAVGTLIWVKDHETTLLAVRRALDLGVDLTLDIVGDGSARTAVRYAIDDLDLGDRVRLWGRRPADEVARRLRESHVLVHTSASEGVSNAVLEAMATGLAVVTTDAGGMREAVRPDVDGLVVPVHDPTAAADALGALAHDPALRARLGASARRRVAEGFGLERHLDGFEALLREAADQPVRP